MSIELNYSQAVQLANFFGGDNCQVTLSERSNGHDGPGVYVHCTDYPEEGSVKLEPEMELGQVDRTTVFRASNSAVRENMKKLQLQNEN